MIRRKKLEGRNLQSIKLDFRLIQMTEYNHFTPPVKTPVINYRASVYSIIKSSMTSSELVPFWQLVLKKTW